MAWTTILPIILLSVPGALLGAYVLLAGHRRRRTPPDLPGDWWSQFEREFRAYADRAARADRSPKARGEVSGPARDHRPPAG